MSTQKSERIENYALRLKEIIEDYKTRTGAEHIDIVAHSMGGLVLREYMQLFGDANLRKAILVNTPNKGITPRIQDYCQLLSSSKECEDMAAGSIFLTRLNNKPVSEKVINVYSTGCEMKNGVGDGIVLEENGYLEGAVNHKLEGNCTDSFATDLHSNVLNPDLHPEFFDLLVEVLTE